ncbi:methyl-accepting chemotaxis protein [Colwellia demingiae]|uniref:Methyl-accepting chemotaxis protein n=1 Tax=Colwellia demingiae TaxID=89401 RepID=A0A5C6Q608_9GAMM|nr:methyl-accepting chemotaxis protein [Colwellia demingiae]TWX64364.1 methyl-accepting chemotaxis protein [Colwellia demingiae]
MNLTVAMKIIGGFTIVSIFLIVISGISLVNLNTIQESTKKQNELAIPTLMGSTELKNKLTRLGDLVLLGYYQTNLAQLSEHKKEFKSAQSHFESAQNKLKIIVQKEPLLLSNLNNLVGSYDSIHNNVNDVFKYRKVAIEQKSALTEKVSYLKEKAVEVETLLLEISYHDLANSKLQRAINLGKNIEILLNTLVSTSFEYRIATDSSEVNQLQSSISRNFNNLVSNMNIELSELLLNNVNGVAEDLTKEFNELKKLLASTNGIFYNKHAQLNAIDSATKKLDASLNDINLANDILEKQLILANETTIRASARVDDSVSSGNTEIIIIMIVSIISAIVITRMTVISITRPLSRVNKMLNIVASGNLSQKLDESGTDEFARLSINCNVLINSLRNLIQSIVSRSIQLAAAAEQTSAVTSQSTVAIKEQLAQVEQVALSTTEMSRTAQSVLSGANDALGEIKQADDEAERVKDISERNRKTIELLAVQVENASQVINQLQQDSASIGGIIDVIRGIADQTNLLALNAAIEAARAGEQGRGFAVVADEVRTLASRTQESTEEIQTMIIALQNGAKEAVSAMNTGKKQTVNCVEQSEEADRALETIIHAVHRAHDRSCQIATTAEDQNAVAHEINTSLESIVAIAEQTNTGSQQTTIASMEVAKLSEELQQSVQEFKL